MLVPIIILLDNNTLDTVINVTGINNMVYINFTLSLNVSIWKLLLQNTLLRAEHAINSLII